MVDDSPQLRGELRTLSSAVTEPVKAFGIAFASVCSLIAFVSLFMRDARVTLAALGMTAVIWLRVWVGLRLRVVQTDGYWLLASSLSKTAWIPLTKIISVTRVWFPGAQRVYVEVESETPFGREIVFEPQFDLGALVGQHPVVKELRDLVARAKARDVPG